MGYENLDKINNLFEQLTIQQKYNYFEEMFGEQLGDVWKNWEDELVEEEIKELEERIKIKNIINDNKDEVIKECLNIMNEEQKLSLYEKYNGGTYSTDEFKEWLFDIVDYDIREA